MSKVIKFLIFIIYSTCVFFMPNSKLVLLLFILNFAIMLLLKVKIKKVLLSTLKILPFVVFTFFINYLLDEFLNALYIGFKLLAVCNATYIYSNITTISEVSESVKFIFSPLKIFKVNTEDIGLLVSISLSMIPVIKNEIKEVKEACKVKNIDFNIKNSKYILSKLLLSTIRKTNYIEESLISRGYN